MAYVLKIWDETDHLILEHVANYADDSIYVGNLNLPFSEVRKSHHLIKWVKENRPSWKIVEKEFDIDFLFD